MERLLHTPEGVRDIYNEECERKLGIQEDLRGVLKSYGCRDIETPTFEFFDVFSRDVGTTPSKDLYKFFDREGNTLVLRPDITPSIARAVAKYFPSGEESIRLCYVGNTFINNTSYQGRLKENTHLGAELIGTNSAQADGEIIAMVVDCLKKSGLDKFQITIGQVEYFRGILKDIHLDEETEEKLKDFISNRNMFGVEGLLSGMNIDGKAREMLLSLPSLYGSVEVLDRAEQLGGNAESRQAIKRLRDLYEILEYYGIAKYISFDLSMLSRYNYYTGIVFRGYTFGSGEAIVRGGRYDNLLKHFGKDAPAIGFVAVVDQLLAALGRQKIQSGNGISIQKLYYTGAQQKKAIALARMLRSQGTPVSMNFLKEGSRDSQELEGLCKQYHISAEEK